MKTLVLVFHPDMSASRVNRLLAARGRLAREADMSGWKTRTRVFMNAPAFRW